MNRNMHRASLLPAMKYRGLRTPRTADEAFRTARYADPFEHHLPEPRSMLANPWFWRFAFGSVVLWCLAAWAVWSVL